MSDFMRDFEKSNPEPEPKQETPEIVKAANTLTVEDMKTYFEAMKESLIQDFKREMSEYMKTSAPADNKDSEHTENEKQEE